MDKSQIQTGDSPKYYPSFKDFRKLPMLWPFVLMFITTILYASGLGNSTARGALTYGAFVFPIAIFFSLLVYIPKLNYYQLDSAGIHITTLGFIHKTVRWIDVRRIKSAKLWGVDGIGVLIDSRSGSFAFGRQFSRNRIGWDIFIQNTYTKDGESLVDGITKLLRSSTMFEEKKTSTTHDS